MSTPNRFPKGNQYWQYRSEHGRHKLFASPKLMWEAACNYFKWADKHPWYKNEQMKKPVFTKTKTGTERVQTIAKIPTARPYTLHGLCVYLDCNIGYFNDFEKGLVDKTDKKSSDFSVVISRIREIIYLHKFEGAAIGAFNANIISRDLGLADKKEISQTTIVVETQEEEDE